MTTGVTVSCFVLSYIIALVLELSRLYLKMPWRMFVIFVFAGLGLLTHGLFIWDRWAARAAQSQHWWLPASLFDWGLVASWALALIYCGLLVRRPTNAIGPFLLPLVLAMIGAALLVSGGQPFQRPDDAQIWRAIHSVSLSLGVISVTVGFAVALMNLLQEYRLKSKRPFRSSIRLPSLEYLHNVGRACLVIATIAIAAGLVSGIGLNVARSRAVNWLQGGIVFSFGLLVWLVIASILEWRASRRATSWAAYLNIATFLIVVIALVLVFAAPHGREKSTTMRSSHPRSSFAMQFPGSLVAVRAENR